MIRKTFWAMLIIVLGLGGGYATLQLLENGHRINPTDWFSGVTSQVESWLPWNWGSGQTAHNPCSGKVTYRFNRADGNIAYVFNPGGRCATSVDVTEGVVSLADMYGAPTRFDVNGLVVTKLARGLTGRQLTPTAPVTMLLESATAVVEVTLVRPL